MSTRFLASLAAVAALTCGVTSAQDSRSAPGGGREATPSESVGRAFAEAWPERPEWLDMYTDILAGSQLGPNDGWFRRAVSQTRFDWSAVRKQYDRNGDGAIAR